MSSETETHGKPNPTEVVALESVQTIGNLTSETKHCYYVTSKPHSAHLDEFDSLVGALRDREKLSPTDRLKVWPNTERSCTTATAYRSGDPIECVTKVYDASNDADGKAKPNEGQPDAIMVTDRGIAVDFTVILSAPDEVKNPEGYKALKALPPETEIEMAAIQVVPSSVVNNYYECKCEDGSSKVINRQSCLTYPTGVTGVLDGLFDATSPAYDHSCQAICKAEMLQSGKPVGVRLLFGDSPSSLASTTKIWEHLIDQKIEAATTAPCGKIWNLIRLSRDTILHIWFALFDPSNPKDAAKKFHPLIRCDWKCQYTVNKDGSQWQKCPQFIPYPQKMDASLPDPRKKQPVIYDCNSGFPEKAAERDVLANDTDKSCSEKVFYQEKCVYTYPPVVAADFIGTHEKTPEKFKVLDVFYL
eukprot:m.307996 g.307996  ORF g.307996 m.307996 type:complete len:417 (+) comp43220_c0_seq1:107-1357(+)